jgi:signal transduction histidine kinase
MFGTLRAKLIVSYAAIAVLCLLLALLVALGLGRDYAERNGFATLREKRALAVPFVQLVIAGEQRRGVARLAPQLLATATESIRKSGLRVLIVDPDTMTVQIDTSMRYDEVGKPFRSGNMDANSAQLYSTEGLEGTYRFPGEVENFQYIAQRVRPGPAVRAGLRGAIDTTPPAGTNGTTGDAAQTTPYIVVLEQPVPRFGIFGDLGQYFLPAMFIALLVSLIAAVILARSISRPVSKLAQAAAAMAHGDYSQRLPVEGHDELAALTQGFNEMASEVGRAHQMERDFIANVSHDLKTPLTSIQGFSQAMLDGAVSDAVGFKQAASIINAEAQRMSRLVSQLLNLSQLQNGLVELELRPADLGGVISQLVLAMQPQAQKAGVELVARSGGVTPTVLADVDRLKQAFGNLIDNALKHTPPGGKVTVEARGMPAGLEVIVQDTGKGIPPQDLARITERFYQVDKARTSPDGRSIGLGLAIAKEIVLAHHGQIAVDSVQGEGTTVRVVLPADTSSAPQTRSMLRGLGRIGRSAKPSVTTPPLPALGNGSNHPATTDREVKTGSNGHGRPV